MTDTRQAYEAMPFVPQQDWLVIKEKCSSIFPVWRPESRQIPMLETFTYLPKKG